MFWNMVPLHRGRRHLKFFSRAMAGVVISKRTIFSRREPLNRVVVRFRWIRCKYFVHINNVFVKYLAHGNVFRAPYYNIPVVDCWILPESEELNKMWVLLPTSQHAGCVGACFRASLTYERTARDYSLFLLGIYRVTERRYFLRGTKNNFISQAHVRNETYIRHPLYSRMPIHRKNRVAVEGEGGQHTLLFGLRGNSRWSCRRFCMHIVRWTSVGG